MRGTGRGEWGAGRRRGGEGGRGGGGEGVVGGGGGGREGGRREEGRKEGGISSIAWQVCSRQVCMLHDPPCMTPLWALVGAAKVGSGFGIPRQGSTRGHDSRLEGKDAKRRDREKNRKRERQAERERKSETERETG